MHLLSLQQEQQKQLMQYKASLTAIQQQHQQLLSLPEQLHSTSGTSLLAEYSARHAEEIRALETLHSQKLEQMKKSFKESKAAAAAEVS